MQLKTILNRVTDYKSFVFGKTTFVERCSGPAIEVAVRPRANGRPVCSICGRPAPGYDTLPTPRRFDFIPMWGMAVVLVYSMRRVNCPRCGVRVERVPWSEGKSPMTTEHQWFLAKWAQRMSWKEVAEAFRVSWDRVFEAVKQAVDWGLAHRVLGGTEAIGIDEVQWRRGHQYQTVVYQLDEGRKRLLWVGPERKAKTLLLFFRFFGSQHTRELRFVCSDMWDAYLSVIGQKAGHVIHVLDRFHIMQRMNKAIHEVRAAEAKRMERDGCEPVLKRSRWVLLKRPENLTEKQTVKLKELLQHNLKSVRSYLMREDFQRFWEYASPTWAGKFLDAWCTRAMRSRIEPMKKLARSFREKRELMLNWFLAPPGVSTGTVEGFNNKLKLITRKSYGFRTQEAYEIALYHNLGALPERKFTHRFF